MRPILTIACSLAAAALIGCAIGMEYAPVKVETKTVTQTVTDPKAQQQITSLEFDVQNLRAEVLLKANEIQDLRTKCDSLAVQLAQKPAASVATSLPVGVACENGSFQQASYSAVEWQVVPRRRLFGGRFR